MWTAENGAAHVSDGDMLALIDGELDASAAALIEPHVLQCDDCMARLDDWRATADLPGEVLPLVDAPAPSATPRAIRRAARRRDRYARLAMAAGIVLLLAAGAAALVPGSPLRAWLEGALGLDDRSDVAVDAVGHAARGMSLAVTGDSISVRLEPVDGVLELRVILSDARRVSVRALDDTPAGFEVGAGTITVRPGAARRLEVILPGTSGPARVLLGVTPLVERRGDDVRLHADAIRDDSIIRFSISGAEP